MGGVVFNYYHEGNTKINYVWYCDNFGEQLNTTLLSISQDALNFTVAYRFYLCWDN